MLSYPKGVTQIKHADDMPATAHYVIFVFQTDNRYVGGDERSRTNPGHGYPAHTVTTNIVEYWAVDNEQVLKEVVLLLTQKKGSHNDITFSVANVTPLTVKTDIRITID